MVYAWKAQARVRLDAQQCGAAFVALEQGEGGLTPARVVEAATPKASPLHGGFEWDNKVAATAYRVHQAGYLLRQIVLVRESDDETTAPEPYRAFVTITGSDADAKPQTVFCAFETAMADPEKRQQVLARALAELLSWQRRYAALVAYADEDEGGAYGRVFQALDRHEDVSVGV